MKKEYTDMSVKYDPPSRLTINLKKIKALNGADVGDKIEVTVKGKVTSLTKNEEYSTMEIEISGVEDEE